MTKALKTPLGKQVVTEADGTTKIVRDPKTGKMVTLRGYGAMKDWGLEIREDVDLLKPIYEQVYGKRTRKLKTV